MRLHVTQLPVTFLTALRPQMIQYLGRNSAKKLLRTNVAADDVLLPRQSLYKRVVARQHDGMALMKS